MSTIYRIVAPTYAAIDPGWRNWFYPLAHRVFDQLLSNSLSEGGDILDLGCGVGANMSRIKTMQLPYTSYTGVDFSVAMLRFAQDRYSCLPNVQFRKLDILNDPLPQGPSDLIISTWVFELIPNPLRVTQKAWDALKPDGKIMLLFESKGKTIPDKLTSWIYPMIGAHRIAEDEYHQFPGQFVEEKHFPGPLGTVTILVLKKMV